MDLIEGHFGGTDSTYTSAVRRPLQQVGSARCPKVLRERRERAEHGRHFAAAANRGARHSLQGSLEGTAVRVAARGSCVSPFYVPASLHLPAALWIDAAKRVGKAYMLTGGVLLHRERS